MWNYTLIALLITTSCTVLTTLIFINYLGDMRRGLDLSRGILGFLKRDARQEPKEIMDWQPIEVIKEELFVQSAIINHHRSISTDVAVIITAWFYNRHHNPFFCCFTTSGGHVIKEEARLLFRLREGWLGPHQFVCFVSKNSTLKNNVYFSVTNCVGHVTKSLPIVNPVRAEGKMAVCAKTIYNKVSAQKLVEWFELQKLQGVHKIQAFHFHLEKEGMKVLEYYRNQGYLILLPITCPVGLAGPPGRGYLEDERPYDTQFQADEQIGVFDCSARLSGYDYVGVYDVDEIVMPVEDNITLPDFLKKMEILQPEAAAFIFEVEQFVTDWGKSNNETDLEFMSYVLRRSHARDRMKIIHMPAKTLWQDTHHAAPIDRYIIARVNHEVATIHHYRTCRFKNPKKCNKYKRRQDRQLLQYEKELKLRVNRVKRELKEIFHKTINQESDKTTSDP